MVEQKIDSNQYNKLDLPPKKKWYKRGRTWVIISICLFTLAGLLSYGWYLRRVGYTHKMISEGWHETVLQADKIIVLLNKSTNMTTLTEASRELHSLDGLVRDKKYYTSQVPSWLNDKKALDDYNVFLEKYGDYISLAASQSDDISVLDEEDFESLQDASVQAKNVADALKSKARGLSESMPDGIYNVAEVLEKVQKKELAIKQAEEKLKSTQQKQAEKNELDRATVEVNVSKFMDGFISGDKEKMKRYMTEAYEKEYDFNQVSAESREYSYPASFRVVDNKKDGDDYQITINVIYKYRGNQNQYTSATEYTVVYSSQYSTWLINSQKYVY